MTSKYLSPQLPILADGDLMAVVVSPVEELATIEYLMSEGLERQEKNYLIYASRQVRDISIAHNRVSIDSAADLITLVSSFREESLRENRSGARLIFIDDPVMDDIFRNAKLMDQTLVMLMKGSLSIARTVLITEEIRGNRFFFHPRIMFRGEVMPNPLFISPSSVTEGDIPFEVFLQQSLNCTSISKGKINNFPTNLPNLFESILDSVPIGIVAGDSYGNMVFFNKEATRIMGLPASPLPYAERIRRFGNLLPDKITPFPFEELPLSRAIRGEEFEGVPLYIHRPALEKGIFLECTGRGMYDSEGNLLGGVVIFQDVSLLEKEREEKRMLETRLLQSQKMESLGLLAGGIAHDFNNLLVGVLGNASVLLQTESVSSPSRVRLEQIQMAGTQLAELTKQLLTYAGLSPAKDLVKESLGDVIEVMQGLLDTAVSKKINLSFDVQSDPLWIFMEPTQIKQVLLNLVVNASDSYGSGDGSVLVSVYKERMSQEAVTRIIYGEFKEGEEYAVLEVVDHGCGMTEEDLRCAFDPFYSSKGVGRGLGLSAVVGIVKNHKGVLEVDTQKGVGSKFKIYFPIIEAPIETFEVKKNVNSDEGGVVLVIDDEKIVLDVAEALLSHAGFQPICVSSGFEGLKKLGELRGAVSLVMVDLTMPDMGGEVVYQNIREEYSTLPVIISSGFAKETIDFPAIDDSCLYFLEKPYPGEKLIKMVREVIFNASKI